MAELTMAELTMEEYLANRRQEWHEEGWHEVARRKVAEGKCIDHGTDVTVYLVTYQSTDGRSWQRRERVGCGC